LETVLSLLARILPQHLDSGKFKGFSLHSHFSPQFPRKTPKFIETKNRQIPHTQIALRHRENIGRIGSPRVFWQMGVIAVFPQKTGRIHMTM
jgi:hypothetical protein